MSEDIRMTRPGAARQRQPNGLYAQVVDALGQEIVDGRIAAGEVIFVDQLCTRFGVSRSVMREGIRTLSSLGFVESRPQVGTRVLPIENWDLLHPLVVTWRSSGPDYLKQMHEILELRLGVEPVAARLAAVRMPTEAAESLLEAAMQMRAMMKVKNTQEYFRADITFHNLLLEGSGNYVLAQFGGVVEAILVARCHDSRPGMHTLYQESTDRHIALAHAVVARDAERAYTVALEIVALTLEEFETLEQA